MKKIKKYMSCFVLLNMIALSSCKKDFLNVNTDPNNPGNVTPELILPAAIGHAAFIIGGEYQVVCGFWAQYWTQGPTGNQYNFYDQYLIPNTNFDRQWTELYSSVLEDFKDLADKGIQLNEPNYAAIGFIMKAYVYQVLTDLHGDVPEREALKGVDAISPHFDPQQNIYDDLIAMLDKGISLIDQSSTAVTPAADDFIYGGDMSLWEKFANTLKLRIYLRQSEIRPAVAQAGVAALANSGAVFLDEGEDAQMIFVDNTGFRNPVYAEMSSLGRQNIMASNTTINYMVQTNDPRIDVFYTPATTGQNAGAQAGINQGDGKLPTFPASAKPDDFSQPGDAIAGPAAPVIFMSASESYFLQAEAIARGWMPGDAQADYVTAITASFLKWGLSGTEATTFSAQANVAYPTSGVLQDELKAIITQKWVSMCSNQCVESWSEWRRTGYPDLFVVSSTSLIGNTFPERLPYPNSEITTNPNTPSQPPVTQKVWWDAN